MKFVCIGDSLTYGYGVKFGEGWVDLLKKSSNHTFINKGVPGNTTTNMLERFQEDITLLSPDAVILMGGTNDIFLGFPLTQIQKRIEIMALEAANSGMRVFLAAPMPVFDTAGSERWFLEVDFKVINEKLALLSENLGEFCSKNSMEFLNLYNAFSSYDRLDSLYNPDGVHINKAAHQIVHDLIHKLISSKK